VLRAFNAAVYQRDKVRLAEETVELSEKAANSVRDLVQQGKLRPADLIVARTEVDDTRALLGSLRVAERKAIQDLRRTLGVTEESFTVQGTLEPLPPPANASVLRAAALERRPDLYARQAAVAEADARLRLTIADRYGNPNIGPDYEYNETRVNFIGAQVVVPLPVLNTRKGEILQREAERTQAALNLRHTEVLINQDVESALSRLENARHWVETYRTEVLPNLQKNLADLERLFLSGEPGVDVLRVINVRRKLLTARDGNLNALYELSQAQADLAAAVGDPTLAIESGPSTVAPPTGPARP
jgi:cobalt-zinc-cadmium efflux system outer membrane protein